MTPDDPGFGLDVGQRIGRAVGKLDGLFADLAATYEPEDHGAPDDHGATDPGPAPAPDHIRAAPWRPDHRPAGWRPTPADKIIAISAVLVGLAVGGRLGAPIQPIAAFWFLLACPGLAVVRLLRIKEPMIIATLSLAVSVGIDTIVSEVMLYTRTWSPNGALEFLVAFSLFALVAARLPLPSRREEEA